MAVIALISERQYKPLNLYLINYSLFEGILEDYLRHKRYKDLRIYGEGEIKSHSTTEVIEPYRKHFESN